MIEFTETDRLEMWLVIDMLAHCHRDDRERLLRKADELIWRLRREGKINDK